MPRPGTTKIDFYPDEEVQEILKNLPLNTRSATLNSLVKAYFSPDFDERGAAEANLEEILRRRNNTSKSKYGRSWVDTANLLHDVFSFMCKQHNINITKESVRYGTVKFSQALREFDIEPDEENLTKNLLVQSAFFKTVGDMRFWQSQVAFRLEEGEVYFFADKWKAGHPPLHDDRMVIVEFGDGTPQHAISQFVGEIRDHYLDKGQSFICRWLENGEEKERHL
ncbi:MAG: hypothetical protein K2X81_11830, partial [Candidatus Obscuribacterales bacterium]|nr:hypothetical protein [Candidatus Obscuribacterales bacterium]